MERSTLTSFSSVAGYGHLEDGTFVHKCGLSIFDKNKGRFRRYRDGEFKPTPRVGQRIVYQRDRFEESSAFWWALDGVPLQKVTEVRRVGIVEIGTVIDFLHDKGHGFISDPCGGEDLLIHYNERRVCRDGRILNIKNVSHQGPFAGDKIAFVIDADGRVVKWATAY